MGVVYQSVLINSLSLLSLDERAPYFSRLSTLPPSIRKIIFSPPNGAYVRGLTKIYNLPLEKAPYIALIILEVFLGIEDLPKLGSVFSSKLQMPNDQAQAMSKDVERELFVPVMIDFNHFLQALKSSPNLGSSGTQNIVNLKERKAPLPPRV